MLYGAGSNIPVLYVKLDGCAINTAFTVVPRCHKTVNVAKGPKRGAFMWKKGKDMANRKGPLL